MESAISRKSVTLPPVIVIGGGANAISIARSLGRNGIKVFALNSPNAYVRYSRFCEWIPQFPERNQEESWARFLLGRESDYLAGAVLLTACDAGIEILAQRGQDLSKKFLLDLSNKEVQLSMLNKLNTYERAVEAGIPTPKFWKIVGLDQVFVHEGEYVYPLIVKPIHSHKFQKIFTDKFVIVSDFEELKAAITRVHRTGIEFMLVEMIPGPDSKLCSYYTYIDESGTPLLHFTKRILRRYPTVQGNACYHISDWNPEVRDLGLKYFMHVGLVGLGNIEFKRDDRDGKLKLIECNARFTAANCLVAESGYDLAILIYNRLIGRSQVPLTERKYKEGLRYWYPLDDFKAYVEMRKRGELTFVAWIKSILHPQIFPYFRWYDPIPTLVLEAGRILSFFKRRAGRVFGRLTTEL